MSHPVATYIDEHFDAFLQALSGLVRIPSISAEPEHAADLRRSAEAVRAAMAAAGLERTELIELPGAAPYAYGERLRAPGRPTLLLYAHHDVQPVGRAERWQTPAFEPTLRADGRLYGRGVVDDKAGVVVHLAAIEAWLRTAGELPINVKMIVEGEEEIGSWHLGELLRAHRARLQADFIVLTDTANLEAGLPSLTYRLRGMALIKLEVTGLDHPLHSGMWGGPVPDPVQALAKILATLTGEDGTLGVPGLYDEVAPPAPAERAALERLPFDAARFRADAGMAPGLALHSQGGAGVYEQLWLRPSITVIGLEAVPIQGSTAQIVPSARARISLRLVPDMDPQRSIDTLIAHLRAVAPWGVTVRVESEGGLPAWACRPEGPAFDAARRALSRAFGREVALIGAGGAIPFVGPFSETFGGAPALLIGLEDPRCHAHSENESLNLEDWRKAMKGAAYFYEEASHLAV